LANFDDLSLRRQIFGQRRRPSSRESVRPPAVVARERLDETAPLESSECLIQGAGLKFHAGELGNVFH
jgi:hypothetical protein